MKIRMAVLSTGVALGALWLLAPFLMARAAVPPPPNGQPAPGGKELARATFAAGCFWCVEPPFDKLPGVVSTTSGYAASRVKNTTYDQVSQS